MAINIRGTRNEAAIRKKVQDRAALQTKELANELGQTMAEKASELIAERFDFRPYARRRHPGTRRAVNAISYEVIGDNFPFNVQYKIVGGKEVENRIIILNNGRSDSTIRPSGNWPLKRTDKAVLAWPNDAGESVGFKAPFRVFKKVSVVKKPITSRATNKGSKFLQQARDEAVNKVFRRGGGIRRS